MLYTLCRFWICCVSQLFIFITLTHTPLALLRTRIQKNPKTCPNDADGWLSQAEATGCPKMCSSASEKMKHIHIFDTMFALFSYSARDRSWVYFYIVYVFGLARARVCVCACAWSCVFWVWLCLRDMLLQCAERVRYQSCRECPQSATRQSFFGRCALTVVVVN